MDKSYVTLATCPICHEENGSLLLDQRLRPRFEMHTPTAEPCQECKDKYLKKGVLLLELKTGSLAVIKNSAFKKIFNVKLPEKHIAFVEEGLLEKIGALRGGER